MKLLILSHKAPYPAIDGGCVAIKNMVNNALDLGYDVKMLSLSTFKHPYLKSAFPEGFLEKTKFTSIEVDTKLNLVDAFSNLVTADSYNVSRFFSEEVEDELIAILNDFKPDVVLLESLFMTPYLGVIKEHSPQSKTVLRSHNLEYLIWQRHKDNSGNPLKKVYLGILVKQLRKYELEVLSRLDGVLAISHIDLKHYKRDTAKSTVKLDVLPLGIIMENEALPEIKPDTLFHLGAMDWEPNLQGLHWFMRDAWPLILAKRPQTKLVLGGKNIDQYQLPNFAENKNIEIVNTVSHAKEFMQKNGIMLVPITIAGGIRIKIIEGMSYGVPVLSTKIGAEGINAKNGKDILLGTTAVELSEQALQALENPDLVQRIQIAGKKFSQTHFNNHSIKEKLHDFLSTL